MRSKLLFILFLIGYTQINAQSIFDTPEEDDIKLEYTGYVRGLLTGGSDNYDISTALAEFAIKPKIEKGNAFAQGDIRLRSSYRFNTQETVLDIKELFVGYSHSKFDLFIGNQIINWGRIDGFSPTNTITPMDYFFLSPEIDDQKLSSFMLRSKYRFTPAIELDLIAIPFFTPSIYRYDLFDQGPNVSFKEIQMPERDLKNGTLAARLNFDFPFVGFSLSGQNGYSLFYGFDLSSVNINSNNELEILYQPMSYNRTKIGADLSLPIRSIILRLEGAYEQTEDYETYMFIPNPNIAYVAGLETNVAEITTILQFIGKYNLDYTALQEPILSDPNDPNALMAYTVEQISYESELFNRKVFEQDEEIYYSAFLSLNRDFFYQSLNAELSGLYNFTTESYLLRTVLSWSINDQLKLKTGFQYMDGPDNSIYALSNTSLNHAFLSLQANF